MWVFVVVVKLEILVVEAKFPLWFVAALRPLSLLPRHHRVLLLAIVHAVVREVFPVLEALFLPRLGALPWPLLRGAQLPLASSCSQARLLRGRRLHSQSMLPTSAARQARLVLGGLVLVDGGWAHATHLQHLADIRQLLV